ncbi:MAG: glycosyltransferase, partial [Candidatus Dormibacteria bacterium]
MDRAAQGETPAGEMAPIRYPHQEAEELAEALSHAEHCLVMAEGRRRALEQRLADAERRLAIQAAPDELQQLVEGARRRVQRLMPHGSRRGALLSAAVRRGLQLLGPSQDVTAVDMDRAPSVVLDASQGRAADEYAEWVRRHEPNESRLAAMRLESDGWAHRPLVSIVMPVYQPKLSWLREAVESVTDQSYTNWELCITDDNSTQPDLRMFLDGMSERDSRIHVVHREERGGISAATNSAIAMAGGDFVGFLDHDDLLRRHALHRVVQHVHDHPNAGLLYSDEDKLQLDGTRGQAFFKPDWSPDLLLSCNYLCHLSVIRRDILARVGGCRSEFDGSQDHDLFLRVTETDCEIVHVADVLYSWRQVE